MHLTRAERETIMRCDEEDKTWWIYTDSTFMANRLCKRGWEPEIIHGTRYWKLPHKAITIRSAKALQGGRKLNRTRFIDGTWAGGK